MPSSSVGGPSVVGLVVLVVTSIYILYYMEYIPLALMT